MLPELPFADGGSNQTGARPTRPCASSSDNTADVVSEWASKGVRHVKCAKQGSYTARNRGVAHAAGDILAFTDADCIPDRIREK